MKYEITEGEHAGHNVVKDKYGIDFCGFDKDTSFYCLDCHVDLVAVDVEEIPAKESEK